MDPKFTIYVAFGEGQIIDGEPILPMLTKFGHLVESAVKPFRFLIS